jgi:hypothetical protein
MGNGSSSIVFSDCAGKRAPSGCKDPKRKISNYRKEEREKKLQAVRR